MSDHSRTWRIILGDQLTLENPALVGYAAGQDAVWMAEASSESTKVWTHKARIVMFLAAMRHFREALLSAGYTVHYTAIDTNSPDHSLTDILRQHIMALPEAERPTHLVMTHAGEWSVQQQFEAVAHALNIPLTVLEDTHFLCKKKTFTDHARVRKQLRLEFFYREMRQQHQCLLTDEGKPEGGQWNYDADNRGIFKTGLPADLTDPVSFSPDALTRDVIRLVESRFATHPGDLASFDWPLTSMQADVALDDFITHRLPSFGQYQDAMWLSPQPLTTRSAREAYLYHARLSAAMNLHLITPAQVIAKVEAAYRQGTVKLASAEGFIRQVMGWREYVRGVYWLHMPQYLEMNALNAEQPLPDFYWTADTPMACLNACLDQTLTHGYAHHIQRLMVTGLYALLLGVHPKAVHQWYLAIYVDAVEWVELPNTLGMSQFGDGGIMGSKPYIASGKYIQRMSNYCDQCVYDPAKSTGPTACPFTTLYWDFLDRHQPMLAKNARMGMQVKNWSRLSEDTLKTIRAQAQAIRVNQGQPVKGLV